MTSITIKCGLLFALFLQFFTVNAQFLNSKRESAILEIVNAQDSLPREIFLDSASLGDMSVQVSNTRQVWNANDKSDLHLRQLFDIRLKFEDHKAALAFHQEYVKENSEFGPEIKKHKINSTGATDFMAFKGMAFINDMMEPGGYQVFCFIYVVDNYFVKLYLVCNKGYKPAEFQDLVSETIRRIKEL